MNSLESVVRISVKYRIDITNKKLNNYKQDAKGQVSDTRWKMADV